MIEQLLYNIGFYLSIIFLVLSVTVILIFNIPLQLEEARVKNGLAKLRIQLLLFGLVLLITNFITLFLLGRFAIVVFNNMTIVNFTMQFLLLIYGISHLLLACIGYMIYHQQYTPENKKLHEKIEKAENKKK